VASLEQLPCVPLVQCSGDEQRDVVDHVAVREVFHELGERAGGVGLDVAELGDELVRGLSGECRRRGIGRQAVEEVAVRGRQLQLDIYSASDSWIWMGVAAYRRCSRTVSGCCS
jgi:hypothetical protein